MNVGEIFTRAWEIIWKHKVLFLLGLIMSLASGGSSSYRSSSSDFFNNQGNQPEIFGGQLPDAHSFEAMLESIPVYGWVLIGLAVLALIVLFIYLNLSATAAFNRGAWRADMLNVEQLSFGQLWREGQPYLLRLFLFGLLGFFISLAATLVLSLHMVFLIIANLVCLALPFCLVFFLGLIFLGLILNLGMIGIVAENLGVIDALKRAWGMLLDHWGHLILISIIQFLISTGFLIVFGLPFVGYYIATQGFVTAELSTGLIVVAVIYGLIFFLASSALTTYVQTTWVVAYNQMAYPLEKRDIPAETPAGLMGSPENPPTDPTII
ncbi:MAG TPA: hypothetical protein PLT26_09185 [Anaerolineaceae bacterium]|nr:hypothetical protein [Anaerolineaceae bacterium]HQH86920.1 hypothetical protein [Anaerolineaceae bacterium]